MVYTLPATQQDNVDRGNEVLAKFREMITNDCCIKAKPTNSKNVQANEILEWVHQTNGNILWTLKVQNMVLDDEYSWDGILASTIFAPRTSVHTTTQYTPAQQLFGRNSIINWHQEDWTQQSGNKNKTLSIKVTKVEITIE